MTAWVTYAGLAPEVSVIDRGGVLLVGLAGAVWLVGLVLLPLAAYRRLRRVLERGALATAVVTEVGPSSSDSAGRIEVVRRIDGPHGTFADRSTVQAAAEGAPAPGVALGSCSTRRLPRGPGARVGLMDAVEGWPVDGGGVRGAHEMHRLEGNAGEAVGSSQRRYSAGGSVMERRSPRPAQPRSAAGLARGEREQQRRSRAIARPPILTQTVGNGRTAVARAGWPPLA